MITDLPTQQSIRPPRAGNSNVYLLGAGFSADAGLPTIADFLNQMRDSTDWLAQQGRQAELTPWMRSWNSGTMLPLLAIG
jgi:hypothetical protein